MGKRLVLAGGGHVHMSAMKGLEQFTRVGHEVILVSPDEYHYYSGMGPGLLGGMYRAEDVRFHVARMVQDRGGQFVRGAVERIEPDSRRVVLKDGQDLSYDVLSLNVGSRVPLNFPGAEDADNLFAVKPIQELVAARQKILEFIHKGIPLQVLVVGGGPAGLECAGNILGLAEEHGGPVVVSVVAGSRFMGRFPSRIRRLALDNLSRRGARILEGVRLDRFNTNQAVLSDGSRIAFHVGILAVGVSMPEVLADSGLDCGPGGGVLVNEHLQSVSHAEIFGGGDCIDFQPSPLDKVGVYAVRENPVLTHNLLAALDRRPLQTFDPGTPDYLLLFNLGDGTAILSKHGFSLRHGLAMKLKDYIDRKFMREFQVSGEV
ncbi:MAG: NAD(P)/FAD-dependent oxidoreductase [Desulfovibrio sp.]|uniref:NAD(P)/FAD-dependent oxidoreductase n=1 Tax=Desulfovibrio sp. 7SRBS1 TaxID=3378064 RepID=UPI003B41BBE2